MLMIIDISPMFKGESCSWLHAPSSCCSFKLLVRRGSYTVFTLIIQFDFSPHPLGPHWCVSVPRCLNGAKYFSAVFSSLITYLANWLILRVSCIGLSIDCVDLLCTRSFLPPAMAFSTLRCSFEFTCLHMITYHYFFPPILSNSFPLFQYIHSSTGQEKRWLPSDTGHIYSHLSYTRNCRKRRYHWHGAEGLN